MAMGLIGVSIILTTFLGFARPPLSGVTRLRQTAERNMSRPLLAQSLAASLFAFVAAIAFATILAVDRGFDDKRFDLLRS